MCTYSEEQVTIIYSEISRPIVPDEFECKWRVKAGNGRLAVERNQDACVFEEALVRETRSGWNNLSERKIYSSFGLAAELKSGRIQPGRLLLFYECRSQRSTALLHVRLEMKICQKMLKKREKEGRNSSTQRIKNNTSLFPLSEY